MMITVKVKIETKKGFYQDTLWGVWHNVPYPYYGGSSYCWSGLDAINDFSTFESRKKKTLPEVYKFALLREGWTPETAKNNREDYAGFNDAPGVIVVRRRSFGEITGEIRNGLANFGYASLSDAERAFLAAQVKPALIKAIDENKAILRAEAIETLRRGFDGELNRLRETLQTLQDSAAEIIKELEN